jgi:hypothetical protein
VSGFVNDYIRRRNATQPRKAGFSTGRRLQLAFRGAWMIALGVAGLWAAWSQR